MRVDSLELEFSAGARVRAITYVFCDASCAVTMTKMESTPTANGMAAEAVPEATAVPLMMMRAVESATVAVTVVEATLFATAAPETRPVALKAGASKTPAETTKADRFALEWAL